MTAGAQCHAELLKDKVRETNENARRHADEHVAAAGRRAKRDRDQHNDHTRPRRREACLQLRVQHRAGLWQQIGMEPFVVENFRDGKLDLFRRSDAAELTDFDFASDLLRRFKKLSFRHHIGRRQHFRNRVRWGLEHELPHVGVGRLAQPHPRETSPATARRQAG